MELNKVLQLSKRYYTPSDTYEYYDTVTRTFYNSTGQELRNPEEYNSHSEGYTPFGDE